MYKKSLFDNTYSIAVWGAGYLGYYTLIKYTRLGINCVLVDTQYKDLGELEGHFKQLRKNYWDYEIFIENELENCTLASVNDLKMEEILVHFVCVPVEKFGKPTYENLNNILKRLKRISLINGNIKPLVIIESSFSPGTTDKIIMPAFIEEGKSIGDDYLMAVAPRRDWDYNPYVKNVSLGRLIGSEDNQSLLEAKEICGLVDENVVQVNSFFEVEMARCVENSLQYINTAFVNQLSQAFPSHDVNKVIRLAATHPDIKEYLPCAGVGGFNFPMSSYFLSESSSVPESLTLLNEAMRTDYEMTKIIADKIASQNIKSILILGLSYKVNARLHVNSPAFKFIELFKSKGIEVKVNDPMYSRGGIAGLTRAAVAAFPEDLLNCDAILTLTSHTKYKSIRLKDLKDYLKNVTVVIDACEVWSHYELGKYGINYFLLGGAGWNK